MSEQKEREPGGGGLKSLIRKAIAWALQRRIVRAYLRYSERNGSSLADGITYRTLFSVFAGVLLGFSIAALWLGGNPRAMQALVEAVDHVVPGLAGFIDPAQIDAPTGFTIVGIVSLLGLVGAAIGAIASLRTALRTLADELHDDGGFLWVLLRNLLVALCFGGLVGLAAGLTMVQSFGVPTAASWLGIELSPGAHEVFTRLFGVIVVFVIDTVAIAVVFTLLSGLKPPRRALWVGAAIGGAGLTVLQELSGLFVSGATSNPLLASFAALIALLLWFNLSAQVILIASCYIIVATHEAEDRVRERFGVTTLAQRRRKHAEDVFHAAARELKAAQEAEREEREKESASS